MNTSLALVQLETRGFSRVAQNGTAQLSVTLKDLLRGVVAAGRDPSSSPRFSSQKEDIQMRISAVKSAVTINNGVLVATPAFQNSGSTDKGIKSYFVGNAMCAHIANARFGIPWLVDFEKLDGITIKVSPKKNDGTRPDFLGMQPSIKWHVFESKGRSSRPGPKVVEDWKIQAESIGRVNGKKVSSNIVSVAYLDKLGTWKALWVDPPNDDNEIEVDLPKFFQTYYNPIIEFIAGGQAPRDQPGDQFRGVPELGLSIGIIGRVREALDSADYDEIIRFANERLRLQPNNVETADETIYPDGIIVRTGVDEFVEERNRGVISPAPQKKTRVRSDDMPIGNSERATQNRIVRLFVDELGYTYLGDKSDTDNSNIEVPLMRAWLERQNKYTPEEISSAISKLKNDAAGFGSSLYDNNKLVYSKLRYGVGVSVHPGRPETTVKVIDWAIPNNNDFAIAEEVTLRGGHTRRPDLVLYVNGIAIAVIELKNSRVSMGEGIRQCLSNQRPEFTAAFFSTIQLVFAGNDSDGLKYGTILTPEQFFLKWKEDEHDDTRLKIDKYLLKLCDKERLIDLMHDFVLFENGIKKVPRPHQYAAVKRAQEAIRRREGGIIWHTQGSGKSIVMVWLAKWILENYPNARIAIVTDRDELDKQIERVFSDAGEDIFRTKSGRDLMKKLSEAKPRLLTSLVHKFGNRGEKGFEDFIRELTENPVQVHGEIFVFVDECHRTQSGKLHRAMKAIMPNALFVGFTGTPLLKRDKATSFEVFGRYIHTYKFSEAVEDEVVLDLVYEARDIPQHIDEHEHIDTWFDTKTRSLNEWQRTELKAKWATMQNVLSSRNRMDRIVRDIIFDFSTKPRLSSERGNAILIASSIYEACKYFDLFQKTVFRGRCAVVTSYNPSAQNVTLEDTGANTETDKQFIEATYSELLANVAAAPGKTPAETYEDHAKKLFIEQPANMRLLIVVDKLLTGFDAPPCTYLYIDKSMQDHGLFQAICRTNRLDGEDKEFGYIVDYMDLFKKVENAISVYSADSLEPVDDGVNPEVLLAERLEKGRQRLDTALEMLGALTQDIDPNGDEIAYIRYFCGNTEVESDLKETEPKREVLYKGTVMLVRAYANIADDLDRAGYSAEDIARIKRGLDHYVKLRDTIKQASGEFLDMKAFEADMRHLIDTYIEADAPKTISPFGDLSLLDLIVKTGIADAINDRLSNLGGREEAIAETIENNVRRKIIREKVTDPEFFEKMSKMLDELIGLRKAKAIDYQDYLKKIAELAKSVQSGMSADTPEALNTPGKRALFNNLGHDEALALRLHERIMDQRPAGWRGVFAKEQEIRRAIYEVIQDEAETHRIFDIVTAQSEY